MNIFENNLSENTKKRLIDLDTKKLHKKNLSRLFILYIYCLIIIAITLYFANMSLLEAIKCNPILSIIIIIGMIGALLIALFNYVIILINISIASCGISSSIKKVCFHENELIIISNDDTLIIPIQSFGKNATFVIEKAKSYFVLKVNSLYLLNKCEEMKNQASIENQFNNYKESILLEKRQIRQNYNSSSELINSFLYQFIYNAYTIYNYFGISKFDIVSTILVILDLFSFRIGLWTYCLTRLLFFTIHCLLLTTAANLNQKQFFPNCIFYFNNDDYAIFDNDECLLYGDTKEILNIICFKKFIVIDTIKGRFLVSNNCKELTELSKNITYYTYHKFMFK